MAVSPSDVLKLGEQNGAKFFDIRFSDLPGLMQHFTIPFDEVSEDAFEEGFGFDGSSIRGFQEIQESDMILVPDPDTAIMDPFAKYPTLVIHAFVKDPLTGEHYSRDPRYIARKAEEYLKGTGIADVAYFGPEAEFYIFDSIRFDQNHHEGYYHIDAVEGVWNSGAEEGGKNLGYKPRYKEGYFPVPPMDHYQDLRSEMVLTLRELGIPVEVHHHEVGTAGQAEIDMGFAPLLQIADRLMLYKYVIKNIGLRHNKTITFMPKPIFQDNGSGMHVHQSLWKEDEPLFWDELGYAQLSDTARWYIGGILEHAPALLALCAPTTNSYKRLVPGYEAPVNLVYSQRNRSACIRIPMYSDAPKAKRIEFRCPDAAANPYLAFAAMLMAGIDGIERGLEPGAPADYDLFEEEHGKVPQVPASLGEALDALEADHEFLTKGGVFSEELIRTWIDYKRENEVDTVRLRPHPAEFALYFDC